MNRIVPFVLAGLALATTAHAGKKQKHPCHKITFETGDFGGPRAWALGLNFGTVSLYTLKETAEGAELGILSSSYQLESRVVPAGAKGEVVLDDGSMLSTEISAPIQPSLIANGSGTVWSFSVPLSDAELASLAESPVKNARLAAGDQVFGGASVHQPQWTKQLQAAAGCLVHLKGESSGEPTTP